MDDISEEHNYRITKVIDRLIRIEYKKERRKDIELPQRVQKPRERSCRSDKIDEKRPARPPSQR